MPRYSHCQNINNLTFFNYISVHCLSYCNYTHFPLISELQNNTTGSFALGADIISTSPLTFNSAFCVWWDCETAKLSAVVCFLTPTLLHTNSPLMSWRGRTGAVGAWLVGRDPVTPWPGALKPWRPEPPLALSPAPLWCAHSPPLGGSKQRRAPVIPP